MSVPSMSEMTSTMLEAGALASAIDCLPLRGISKTELVDRAYTKRAKTFKACIGFPLILRDLATYYCKLNSQDIIQGKKVSALAQFDGAVVAFYASRACG